MAGESTGADQWCNWQTAAGGSWLPLGVASGGPTDGYDLRPRKTIGGEEVQRAGVTTRGAELQTILYPDSLALLEAICPAAGALPALLDFDWDVGLDAGADDDASVQWFELTLANEQPIGLNFGYIAMPPGGTAGASGGDTALTDAWNFEDWESEVVFGSSHYGVQSVTFRVDFPGIFFSHDTDGRTTYLRTPRSVVRSGKQRASVTRLEMLVPPTINLNANYPNRDIAVGIAATNNSAAPLTVTADLTGLMWDGKPKREYVLDESELVVWSGSLTPARRSASYLAVTV